MVHERIALRQSIANLKKRLGRLTGLEPATTRTTTGGSTTELQPPHGIKAGSFHKAIRLEWQEELLDRPDARSHLDFLSFS